MHVLVSGNVETFSTALGPSRPPHSPALAHSPLGLLATRLRSHPPGHPAGYPTRFSSFLCILPFFSQNAQIDVFLRNSNDSGMSFSCTPRCGACVHLFYKGYWGFPVFYVYCLLLLAGHEASEPPTRPPSRLPDHGVKGPASRGLCPRTPARGSPPGSFVAFI